MRNVAEDYSDINRHQLERIRDLMDAHVRDCLVTNYEDLIDALVLPDPDDRHVLATAIRCGASVIVTSNLKDFPADVLSKYGLEAQHPDTFISHLFDLSPSTVCGAAQLHRDSLRNPPLDAEQFLQSLARQGLANTVAMLRDYQHLI